MGDSFGQITLGHSFRAEWAKLLVRSRIAEFYTSRKPDDLVRTKLPGSNLEDATPENLPYIPETKPSDAVDPDGYKVCIIGAGVAGLFTAMTIDYLNEMVPDLNFSYEILEAADESRFGGRLYTHKFSEALHDYYDVGAMRFPEIPIVERYILDVECTLVPLTLSPLTELLLFSRNLDLKSRRNQVLEHHQLQ